MTHETNSSSLIVEGLSKSFPTRSGELVVLSDVALSASPGDSMAIMGPSGSGKSTLLNILGTLEPPTTGSFKLGDVDPFTLAERELARFRNTRIGFVFQEHHLLPQCSVIENVLIPTLVREDNDDRTARAHELLGRVGLAQRLEHRPAELSGGERQRVAIARALINQPSLVLADEPTGNLDRKTSDAVAQLLIDLQQNEQTILIVVTHSPALANRFERRMEMLDGKLQPM